MFCYQLSDCVRSGTSIGIARYTQKNSERIHSHTFTEIVCILKGKATHYVDGVPYILYAGSVIYIKPGSSHMIFLDDEVTYLDIYNGNPDNENLSGVYTFSGMALEQLKTIVEDMYREYVSAAPLYESVLLNYYKIFIDLIRRQTMLEVGKSTAETTRTAVQQMKLAQSLQELACSVRLNPKDSKSMQEVAAQLHYSASYLSRKFTALFGISYTAYVYQQKFQHVCYLMERTDMPIDDLLKKCGISDKTRFYRDFRDKFSATPQQYRSNLTDKSQK